MGDVAVSRQQAEDAAVGVDIAADDVLHLSDGPPVAQTRLEAFAVALLALQHEDKQVVLFQRLLNLHVVCVAELACHHQRRRHVAYEQRLQYLLFQLRRVEAHRTLPPIELLHPPKHLLIARQRRHP